MDKEIILDEYEQDIEDHFESLVEVENMQERISMLGEAAQNYIKKKKSITIRISEMDLEAMQIKASKLGIPYQTYIRACHHLS